MLIVGSRKCTTSNVRQSCYNVELNQMKTKSSIKCSVNITVQVECSSTETKWTKRLSRVLQQRLSGLRDLAGSGIRTQNLPTRHSQMFENEPLL